MSTLQHTEVELTFPLLNPDVVRHRMTGAGKTAKQCDTYLNAPHRDFVAEQPISDWLRIRESDRGASVTFKHWHNQNDAQAVSCDEYETPVADAAALRKLFEALGFRELVVVEKVRHTWLYKDVEIALDEVTDLGTFIELEAKGAFHSIDEAKAHLYAVLKELGAEVGPQDYRGYPHLLLEKQGKLKAPAVV